MSFVIPLALFGFAMALTPGPNNMMLAASGANFGFRRTLPHMLGVVVGFSLLVILCAVGVGGMLMALPSAQRILRYVGGAYLLYLSYRIATTRAAAGPKQRAGRPLQFSEALMLQHVNPKGWMAAIGGLTTFLPSQVGLTRGVSGALIAFALPTISSVCVWTGFGTVLGRLLRSEKALRVFNLVMGLGLALTTIVLMLN